MGKRPNFLIIVADDLGYSDVGCFGSEIRTPRLDRMAKEGLQFTDFHTAATCSPTRAMLFSGTDSHLSGLGAMAEGRAGATLTWDRPGYEGYLNFDVATLPEILAEDGYFTLLSGKWHLGFKPECNPAARGFARSLSLLPGQTNHWAFHPELDQFNGFLARMPILHTVDGKRKIYPTNTKNSYEEGFYSSNVYTDTLIQYLQERTAEEKQKPFFAALTFAAPHWPLQCSKTDQAKYKGVYDGGPSALRESRIKRMHELGVIGDITPHPVINELPGGKDYVQWEQMTAEEKAKSARAMETYAGMVDNIDTNVGRVLDYLESIGEADNTLVCFMSDNGAEGAAIEARAELGDLMDIAHRYYDNRLENIGNYNSFVWYGPRWAQASTAPHKLYKGYSTENGIRVPFILKYPKWPTGMTRGFSNVMDLAPTILELANIQHPVPPGQVSGSYRGRKVYGMRGKSWVRAFDKPDLEDVNLFHGSSPVGWELGGKAALRKGKWKITYLPVIAFGEGRFELYDMVKDPGETTDLSLDFPDVYQELLADWEKYIADAKVFWPPMKGPKVLRPTRESIGGDPIEQCTAWMKVGEGGVAAQTLPIYTHLTGVMT